MAPTKKTEKSTPPSRNRLLDQKADAATPKVRPSRAKPKETTAPGVAKAVAAQSPIAATVKAGTKTKAKVNDGTQNSMPVKTKINAATDGVAVKAAPAAAAKAAPKPLKAKAATAAAPAAVPAGKTPSEKLAAVRAAAAARTLDKPVAAPAPAPVVAPMPEVVVVETRMPHVGARLAPKMPATTRQNFKTLDYIVYPAHGVGQIIAIEEQVVAGYSLELFVILFAKDKMTLKVPLPKVLAGAIRRLADADTVKKSLDTLTGRARIKRTMWSRRAQEYEAKINSGDLAAIAEVVRDLYRSDAQPEQSYSERQLYEAALDRMGREIASVMKLTETEGLKLIEGQLQKGPRRGPKIEADAEPDAGVEEAA